MPLDFEAGQDMNWIRYTVRAVVRRLTFSRYPQGKWIRVFPNPSSGILPSFTTSSISRMKEKTFSEYVRAFGRRVVPIYLTAPLHWNLN